ncbi:hypothetical protein D9M68_582400 [compost metagenome]
MSKDYVHILVSSPPNLAPRKIMRRIKGGTASKLSEEFSHEEALLGPAFLGAWVLLRDSRADDGRDNQAVSGASF